MGAPGLTSPIRAEGFLNLQLNAGVFIPNLDMSAINSAQTLKARVAERIAAGTTLGMTSGGGTFNMSRERRQPGVDGRRYDHVGADFIDSMDGYLTGTLVEIVPENWQTVIGTTEPFESNTDTKTAHKVKTALTSSSYLNNLVWVGDVADGRLTAIEISNALNTADVAFTFADKNEGKLPFEFHAHQANVNVYDQAPFKVHFFKEALYYGATFNVTTRTAMPPNTFTGNTSNGAAVTAGNYFVSFRCADLLDALDNGYTFEFTFCSKSVAVDADAHVGNGVFEFEVALTSAKAAQWRASVTKPSGGSEQTFALNDLVFVES